MSLLNAQLLAAHEAADYYALVTLYMLAADSTTTPQAARFYLTHAYVFALECNHAAAVPLRSRLEL